MDQPPLPEMKPYVNRNLFSEHFLDELLPQDESWQVDQDTLNLALQAVSNLHAGREEEWAGSVEAQLERKLVRPVLEALGHRFEVQPSLPTPEAVHRPDYAFFVNDEERQEALRQSGGEIEYFDRAIAVGDAKRWDRPLDKGQRGSRDKFDRLSPSWQMDYYLRMSGVKWGILTNGRLWRLYNQDTSFRLDICYEIDLPRLLATRDLEAFKYFFLFFRRQAFVPDPEGLRLLDRVYQGSLEFAKAVGDDLKENVYKALRLLAEGFLHTRDNRLDPDRDLDEIHANSLVLLYRLLFINYAEDRGLLPRDNRFYNESYGLVSMEGEIASRLQRRESLPPLQATYWGKLKTLFDLINQGSEALGIDEATMQVPPYNGGLFDPQKHPFLEQHKVEDRWLAQVIDLLARSQGEGVGGGFVDYSNLDVRHLGSIYEGLLEYKLRVADEEMVAVKRGGKEQWIPANETGSSRVLERVQPGSVYLATDRGERKATGSYYTPDYIVKYIVEHTVGPLIQQKMKEDDPIEGILSLKVLDPAMGSGHFLVEATDRLAHALVEALGGSGEEPGGEDVRWARREVVERCIYGVDLNPLAVELAKLSLWLHTVAEGKPLNFLDHHLKVGNSLIGAWVDDLGSLPVARKRRTSREAELDVRQMNLFEIRLDEQLPVMLNKVLEIIRRRSDTLDDIKAKSAADQAVEGLKAPFKAVADLWVGTYFGNEVTQAEYQEALEHVGELSLLLSLTSLQCARQIAEGQHFFHWELEFPEVFCQESARRKNPGFDVVVGNPPYDELSKQALGRDPDEKAYLVAASVYKPTQALGGRLNWYHYFMVLSLHLLANGGRNGLIVPMSWMGDSFTCGVRKWMLEGNIPIVVEAFPQKDDPNERVFFDAKLPTSIYIAQKGRTQGRICVRVHPGRSILQNPHYCTDVETLKLMNPELWPIPPVSKQAWDVLLKIVANDKLGRLGQVAAEPTSGEIIFNQATRPFLTSDEAYDLVLRGSHVQRYELAETAKQGEPVYLKTSEYLEASHEGSKAYAHRNPRIVYQEGSAIDAWRRVVPTYLPEDHICGHKVCYFTDYKMDMFALLSVFASNLLNWLVEALSVTNSLPAYLIANLPFPKLDFSTPFEHRAQGAQVGRQLYERSFQEGYASVLGFVGRHLSQGETAVIHDLLAHLGRQMIDMHKSKQTEARAFLGWVASYTRLPIEEWRLKTVVKTYWEQGWDEFQRAVRQNRNAIEQASGRDVESREAQESIRGEFDKSTAKLDPLLKRIASTDRLIDLIVYRLYGLTEEEISIVEESLAH